jgi:hypothetical protein
MSGREINIENHLENHIEDNNKLIIPKEKLNKNENENQIENQIEKEDSLSQKSFKNKQNNLNITEEEVKNICNNLIPDYINEIKTILFNQNNILEEKLYYLEKKDAINEIKINKLQTDTQFLINKISKIDELKSQERKISDQFFSLDIKVSSLQKELLSSIYKYDKIFVENLLIPGLIGDYCKFKNMKDFTEVEKYIIF